MSCHWQTRTGLAAAIFAVSIIGAVSPHAGGQASQAAEEEAPAAESQQQVADAELQPPAEAPTEPSELPLPGDRLDRADAQAAITEWDETRLGLRFDQEMHIARVREDSIADRANLQAGDRVIRIGQRTVDTPAEFLALLQGQTEERIPLVFERGGEHHTVFLQLTEDRSIGTDRLQLDAPDPPSRIRQVEPIRPAGLGIQMVDSPTNVLVTGVYPDSPAERSGLRPGDVLVRLDGVEVETVDEVQRLIAGIPPGTPVRILIRRNGQPQERRAVLTTRRQALRSPPPPDEIPGGVSELADRAEPPRRETLLRPDLEMLRRLEALQARVDELEREVAALREKKVER